MNNQRPWHERRNYLRGEEEDKLDLEHHGKSLRWIVWYMLCVLLIVLGVVFSSNAHAEAKCGPWSDASGRWEGERSDANVLICSSPQDCKAKMAAYVTEYGKARTSGYAYIGFQSVARCDFSKAAPAPTCSSVPRPLAETRTQTCPAGTVGTFGQTREYVANPAQVYPDQCWQPGTTWLPASSELCLPQIEPEPEPQPSFALRINAGGGALGEYESDRHFSGGATTANCNIARSGVYATRRWDPVAVRYAIPVAAGDYTVRLLYGECWNSSANIRLNSVLIEGVSVPQFDTYRADGAAFAIERTVSVADSTLNITINAVRSDAMVNAIEVFGGSTTTPEPPTPEPPPPSEPGTVTLSWTAPTQNTDGTALTNLVGYTIHYGTSAGMLNQTIAIYGAGVSSHVIEGLAPGTWFFAVRAYNSSGAESANSNVVTKAVP